MGWDESLESSESAAFRWTPIKFEWTFHSGKTLSIRHGQILPCSSSGWLTDDDDLSHLAKERSKAVGKGGSETTYQSSEACGNVDEFLLVGSKGFHHTFVEIEVIPPLHRHNIPKPHVGDLVRLGSGNVLLSGKVRVFRINQECARPTSD